MTFERLLLITCGRLVLISGVHTAVGMFAEIEIFMTFFLTEIFIDNFILRFHHESFYKLKVFSLSRHVHF